jgi:pimeloyl-ACP methyl ester carboxylesterase
MKSRCATCAGKEIHYLEWGAPDAPAVVMWHGLARHAGDFDDLARSLAASYRIICPDTIGRGLSQWAADPALEYTPAFYAQIAVTLLSQLQIHSLRWIGTSMGGLLGIALAAGSLRERITHLLLNDIGPVVEPAALQRIVSYVGHPPVFDTLKEMEQWFRTTYAPFGIKTDEGWRKLTETSFRRTDSGKITVHYDPRILGGATPIVPAADPWALYDRVACKTLVLRGKDSDVLSAATAREMGRRGPRARLVEFPGFGHAPALIEADQQRVVAEFLGEPA